MNERDMEVLQQYDLDIYRSRKGRGAMLLETNEGLKILKEYRGTEKRLAFEDEVLRQVKEQGYQYVDGYVHNREGGILSSTGERCNYVVKDWFDDRECDVTDYQEILAAVRQLARLHGLLRKVEWKEEWEMGSTTVPSLMEEFERHNRELKRTRTFMRGKRKKSEFELCALDNFERFYEQADKAQAELAALLERCGQIPAYLCHGDYSHHHIFMGSGYIAVLDYTKMHKDVQMVDLYYFMRKILEKRDWNRKEGLGMLDAYDQVLPIQEAERGYLYCLFLYPEKYWKQMNFYFNGNKAWIPSKNIEKLQTLENQLTKRQLFLNEIR